MNRSAAVPSIPPPFMTPPSLPPPSLPPHRLKVVLIHPQIAPNTGNIGRLCVATGSELHLVRPLGFVLSDRNLRRSAMDYWSRLRHTLHDDAGAFLHFAGEAARLWMFDSAGEVDLWDADFQDGDWLVFGSETRGIPPDLMARAPRRSVRIPQVAGIALYEAIRRTSQATTDARHTD